jgi:hypothetical protein
LSPRAERPSLALGHAMDAERALATAGRLEQMFCEGDQGFPAAVDTLWAMFNDSSEVVVERRYKDGEVVSEKLRPRVEAKVKVAIAQALARLASFQPQSLAGRGLSRSAPRVTDNRTVFAVFGDVSPEQFAALPESAQETLRQLQLGAARAERAPPAAAGAP